MILNALASVFTERTSILVSAFMFATLHIAPVSFVHTALLGLVLAVVRFRSGSIYPCMAIHGGFNAAVVLLHWW